jgi:glycine dehydrogenase subunit 1
MHLPEAGQVDEMLEEVGLDTDQLFADVPQPVRRRLEIPEGRPDREVEAQVRDKLAENTTLQDRPGLLGGGSYDHWIPPETRYLAQRGELLTSYTPYQAEINQGLLQALFEFQTLSARLLELDVANNGLYDGASAAAEACLMALRVGRGKRVLVPEHLPRQRASIIENYVDGAGGRVETIPTDAAEGTIDTDALQTMLADGDVGCVHVEHPNAFGCLEPMDAIGGIADEADATFTVHVPEVTALGLIHGPGHYGADIATAEGQPLALPPSYGGPSLGLFAAREEHLRKMPGRITGETQDEDGREAYCLTLQTREQHIRRSRATSNICTNQSFLALMFTVTLGTLGETGFRNLAETNAARARQARQRLQEAGAEIPYEETHHYNEFCYEVPGDRQTLLSRARERGVEAGLPADQVLGREAEGVIACVTETLPDDALDTVVEVVEEGSP